MLKIIHLLLFLASLAAFADETNLLRVNPSFESATGGHRNGDYHIEGGVGRIRAMVFMRRATHLLARECAVGKWRMPDG